MDIKVVKQTIIPILKKHNVRKASLFGSLVRGEMKQGSDIDILVELPKDYSLFDFIQVKLDLEDKIKQKVDLVEYGSVKPILRKSIFSEQIPIYSVTR